MAEFHCAWRLGWLQVVNFIQLGLAVIGLTLAMGDVLRSRRAARVGRRALTVTGLAQLDVVPELAHALRSASWPA